MIQLQKPSKPVGKSSYPLKSLKHHGLVGRLGPLLAHFKMLKECSSGVGNPIFGEMWGRCLTSGKKQIFHGKLLKATKLVLSKVRKGVRDFGFFLQHV